MKDQKIDLIQTEIKNKIKFIVVKVNIFTNYKMINNIQ